MGSTLETVLKILAAVDFVGAVVAGLLGQRTASLIMMGAAAVAWAIWVSVEIERLRRAVAKAQAAAEPAKPDGIGYRRHDEMDAPGLFSFQKKNATPWRTDFIHWPRCTVMLWVKVSSMDGLLRGSPDNRYLLAYCTGSSSVQGETRYYNVFSLLYVGQSKTWRVWVTNSAGDTSSLSTPDALDSRWHHFLIAWDRDRPITSFWIDGKLKDKSDQSLCWPEYSPESAGALYIGSWKPKDKEHYCETELCHLAVIDRYLEPGDQVVGHHLSLTPGSIS